MCPANRTGVNLVSLCSIAENGGKGLIYPVIAYNRHNITLSRTVVEPEKKQTMKQNETK